MCRRCCVASKTRTYRAPAPCRSRVDRPRVKATLVAIRSMNSAAESPARRSAVPVTIHGYSAVRAATLDLCVPLTAEDCQVQSMPDASPTKWHLAHTTWFFETFVLERWQESFRPFRPDYRILFNSYYQTVGEQYSRPQ